MSVSITVGNSTFQDNAKVVGVINEGAASEQGNDVLQQLEALRMDLDKVEQLRAAITSLESAIREQNQPKAKTIMQQLISNFASSFLANVISGIVSPLLG